MARLFLLAVFAANSPVLGEAKGSPYGEVTTSGKSTDVAWHTGIWPILM